MYSFNELYPDPPTLQESFAYWLCRLHKLPKPDVFSADNLKSAMGYHFEVEEQAYTPKMLLMHQAGYLFTERVSR